MFPNKLIIRENVSKYIKDFEKSLIKECMDQRHTLDTKKTGNSFVVNSKHTNFLYNIFYQICNMNLNKFNLKDINFKMWCYLTDEKFFESNWHDHSRTTTINCVLYLKTQNKGIYFKHNDDKIYILPNEGDMLIFPSFLWHLPEPSQAEPRITLNLELRCIEKPEKIFNL